MATQLEDDFDQDQADLDIDPADDAQDQDQADDHSADEQSGEEEDVVLFGADEPVQGEEEPEGVRNLREHARKLERELKEYRSAQQQDEVGEKPTLESCDYDEDAFAEQLTAYHERQRAVTERQRQQQAIAEKQQQKWGEQQSQFEQAFTGLKFAGKDAARAKVEAALLAEAVPMLVKAAKGNAAGLMVALGSSPDKLNNLKQLIDDGDWAEFIAEAAVMAKEVRVERRKPTTTPEQVHGGRSGGGSSGDAKLERLEAEARKSGDRSKVVAYKAELKRLGK